MGEAVEEEHVLPWTLDEVPEGEWAGVAGILPSGYDAYLRVFHPFTPEDFDHDWLVVPETRRSWRSMGAAAGVVIGPTTTLSSLRPAFAADPLGTGPWSIGEGVLDLATATELYETLSADGPGPFCFEFGLAAIIGTDDHRVRLFRSSTLEGWRSAVEQVRAAGSLGIISPEAVWPDDLRWIAFTDYDLTSTYVAADRATADRLLAHPTLEVVEVGLRTRIDNGAHQQLHEADGTPVRALRPSRRLAERPLLLLDVDGVLQPTGSSVPPGYQRFTDDTSSVVLRPEHGPWLLDLAEHFDLVWASTWGASANEAIGRRLGLPELPHVELGELPRHGTRKLAAVQAYVGDRAVVWIDDELYDDAEAWRAERSPPTFLRRTAGGVGLTELDVKLIQVFRRVAWS